MNSKLRPSDAEALADRFGTLLRRMRAIEAEIGCVLLEIASRGVAESYGCRTLARWVELRAGISRQAAGKLIRRARALNPSPAVNGTVEPALAPATGAAARKGAVSTPIIDAIVETLRQIPMSDREWVEHRLLELASRAGPAQVKAAGERLIARLDRDPVLADIDSAAHDAYASDISSPDECEGDACPESATPDPNSLDLTTQAHEPDATPSDASTKIVGDAGESVDTEDHLDGCDATTPPTPNMRKNEPTILGRLRRLIAAGWRRVLSRKDRNCGYPGCHRPSRHCPGHDIEQWADREPADVFNLVVLSGYRHPQNLAPPDYVETRRRSRRDKSDPPQPFAA